MKSFRFGGVRPLLLALLALLLLSSARCAAAPEQPMTAQILDFGIVLPVGQQQRKADPTSATGYVTRGDTEFQEHTTVVPLVQGTAFGIAYRIEGLPAGQAVRLTQVIGHPPMKKPDGSVLREQVSYEDVNSPIGVVEGKLWYILREEYELVPGPWTVTLLHEDKGLLKQEFTVQDSAATGF